MTRTANSWRSVVVALALSLVAIASPAGNGRQEGDEDAAALLTFNERVTAYAALHRQLAASIPIAGSQRMDRRSLLAGRVVLAAAIRNARPDGRQGDLFTPVVTRIFRDVITDAGDMGEFWSFTPPMDEEGRFLPGLHPRVYDPFPGWKTDEIPAAVVDRLPTLPSELEYRLIEYDLVLWDICADLIVDVLPYAVPHPTSDFIYR